MGLIDELDELSEPGSPVIVKSYIANDNMLFDVTVKESIEYLKSLVSEEEDSIPVLKLEIVHSEYQGIAIDWYKKDEYNKAKDKYNIIKREYIDSQIAELENQRKKYE